MLTFTYLPAVMGNKHLSFTRVFENITALTVVPDNKINTPGKVIKSMKPQQLIAGMAFRLFGLDVMPVYKANTAFMQPGICGRQLTDVNLNGHATTINRAAQLFRTFYNNNEVARQGMIKKNNVVDYVSDLSNTEDDENVISFSRVLDNKEIVVVYNTSETEVKEKFISLDNEVNAMHKQLDIVYGYDRCASIHICHGKNNNTDISYLKMYLKPMHLVILKNY